MEFGSASLQHIVMMIHAKKSRSFKSSSSKTIHDKADAAQISDGKKKRKKALARRVKMSVEDDHLENIHDDTFDHLCVPLTLLPANSVP